MPESSSFPIPAPAPSFISIAGVLAWSAIPAGAWPAAGRWSAPAASPVYAVIGAVVALLVLASLSAPWAHAVRHLPAGEPEHADTP